MQLAGEKKPSTDSDVISKQQEEGLEKGDATNLPLRGRLPRRRGTGAVQVETQSADSYSGEIDAPEAQPQMLQGTQDQCSLTDARQESRSVGETEIDLKELEKLRNDLSALEQQLATAKEGSARADSAEAQLHQLTQEMAATVPLDIHEKVVRLERESLVVARTKMAQVTAELKEKEVILSAVKQEMMAEQERLLDKVRGLSGQLSRRVSAEEVEAAVTDAVHELEIELRKALKRAESMKLELEKNEKILNRLQKEWGAERTSLRGELSNVKEQLTELQREQAGDRTKFMEAEEKVNNLEDTVTRLQQSLVEAEEERISREKIVLASVRSLVADMVKTKRAKPTISTVDSRLLKATEAVHGNDQSELKDSEASQTNSAADELESILSEEKAVALETFFNIMGTLIQEESEKLESTKHRLRKAGKLEQDLGNVRSSEVDVEIMTKPTITLYYESSWEFAYLHYSANSSGWTELPGVCMRNDRVVNNIPRKVIDVEGSSIEFVLTDGRGSWDCAPVGGNYHIKNSGTFLLSSGFIEQKH